MVHSQKVNREVNMGITTADSEFIKGKVPISGNKFQFVHEAIINSLEANNSNCVQIEITFCFSSSLFDHIWNFERVDIADNGDGFREDDYERFIAWGDTGKKKNNRGSGRMQFYHCFKEIYVCSLFCDESGKKKKRSFMANSTDFVERNTMKIEEVDQSVELRTAISLKNYIGKDKNINDLDIDDFVDLLRINLLLRFYLEKKEGRTVCIKVEFKKGDKSESREFSNEKIREPDKNGELHIPYERVKLSNNKTEFERSERYECIRWAYFETSASSKGGNEIKICSKNIPVQPVMLNDLNKNCQANGKHYLTVFYGDIFDAPENVKHSIDGFTFPLKKDFRNVELFLQEKEEFIFFDTIKDEIEKKIPDIYVEIGERQKKQKIKAEEIAKKLGIGSEYVDQINVQLSDREENIAEKLYKTQAKKLAGNAVKIAKIDEELRSINPAVKDYELILSDLVNRRFVLTTEQDREELSKYVIRRNFITELLHKILNDELYCQQDEGDKRREKEGVIHDLFFKRRTETDSLNNLWVLNEDFIYYHGYSDTPLSKIKLPDGEPFFNIDTLTESDKLLLERRPDIYLFAEEGACIIVEFKNKDENLADHVQQTIKYCGVIANYGKLKIKKFFCYLVGEKLIEKDLDSEYKKTVYGDMCRNFSISADNEFRNPIADGQLEIIKLSSLEKRSKNRSRIFAEKLGLACTD
ncbi:MAG: hypothetical protein LBP41_04060 [Holosporaceae bacterium]|jgi:hypothetical protein|nr:hypothetical protein [Holosporaceae bacterium]